MGLLGFPLSVPLGSHEDFLSFLELKDIGSGARARFTVKTGYAQNYRLEVDGIAGGLPVYVGDGETETMEAPYNASGNDHAVFVCPQGDWASGDIDISGQGILWQASRMDRLHANVTVTPRCFAIGVTAQLTNVVISGMKRFANCRSFPNRPTWGVLDVAISDSGGTRTVTASNNGVTVATGSRVGNGAIIIANVDGKGVSITATVTYTADVATGGYLVAEYPAKLKLHYRTSAFGGGDFPRTAEATVYDDGYANKFVYQSPALSAGTYNFIPHQEDPQGNESTGTSASTVTIVAPPVAPTALLYLSGDYSNTAIQFAASATALSTYDIYDSTDTEVLDIETVTTTRAAGVGTLTKTLGTISNTFTGTRYIVVRSLLAGVDDGNVNTLEIEYLNGAVVLKRPNSPGVNGVSTVGLILTVAYAYDSTEEKQAPTHIRLYVWDENGGSPSYGTPQTVSAISTVTADRITTGTINYTVAGAGLYRYALRAYSSVTLQESNNINTFPEVYLTTTPMGDGTVSELYAGL